MRRGQVVSLDPLRVHLRGDVSPIRVRPTSVTVAVGDRVLVAIVDHVAYVVVRVEPPPPVTYGNLLLRPQSNALIEEAFVAGPDAQIGIHRYTRKMGALRLGAATTTQVMVRAATRPVSTAGHTAMTGHLTGRVAGPELEIAGGHRAFDETGTPIDTAGSGWDQPIREPRSMRWDVALPPGAVAVQLVVQVRHYHELPIRMVAEFGRLGLIVGTSPVTGEPGWVSGGIINTDIYRGP